MQFGICPLSVVPVRSIPSHHGELHSQLLFGELFAITERHGKQWVRIKAMTDGFEGWVEQVQCKVITASEYDLYRQNFAYSLELVQPAMGKDHFVPITMGARLPLYDGLHFRLGELVYTFSGQAFTAGEMRTGADFLQKIAKRYLGAPFLMGGRSPFGIDSSGFIQLVFQFAGVMLPRSAAAQIEIGTTVDFIEKTQVGDLAFFENKFGKISHVGMIMPEQRIIHSHGAVRIDALDHYGIFDESRGIYTRRLRLIKRILPTERPAASDIRQMPDAFANQPQLF